LKPTAPFVCSNGVSRAIRTSLCKLAAAVLAASSILAQETPGAPAGDEAGAEGQKPASPATDSAPPSLIAIEIDLTAQKAWVLQDGQRVYETPISSGRTGYETPTGDFSVLEKDPDHKSSLYGKIVDGSGRVLISDADGDMAVPAGGRFERAPMKHFLRFEGAIGMHAGRLPGYPASHGCVRLPASKAALFYNVAEVGMPVRVFGKAPRTGPPLNSRKVASSAVATPAPATMKPSWLTRLFTKSGSAQPTPAGR
jgi:hypothetical protein